MSSADFSLTLKVEVHYITFTTAVSAILERSCTIIPGTRGAKAKTGRRGGWQGLPRVCRQLRR